MKGSNWYIWNCEETGKRLCFDAIPRMPMICPYCCSEIIANNLSSNGSILLFIPDAYPNYFEYSSHTGPCGEISCSIKYDDNMQYVQLDGVENKSITIKPSDDKWMDFWKRLESINIWSWEDSYYGEMSINDGVSWDLSISYNDKFLKSHGYEKYPECFNDFIKALKELLGGLEIGYGI